MESNSQEKIIDNIVTNCSMKIGIVITGIICDNYLDEMIRSYENCTHIKIISTWNYVDTKIIEKLKENNFKVIQSDFPNNLSGTSVNYQNYSTYMGIEYSKTFNVTHVIRMRCDMICTNINKYINICENRYELNKMIYLYYLKHDGGYLIDYTHFGSIEDTLKYINHYQDNNDNRFPEKFRQEQCYGTSEYNIIKENVIFILEEIVDSNIDFLFIKDGYRQYVDNMKGFLEYNRTKI
jgi:hypothetical protein